MFFLFFVLSFMFLFFFEIWALRTEFSYQYLFSDWSGKGEGGKHCNIATQHTQQKEWEGEEGGNLCLLFSWMGMETDN